MENLIQVKQNFLNWTVQITQQGTTNPQTATTDSTGSFMIPNLCNGTYTLTEELQPGWSETVPVNPDSYTINITTGNAITDEIFGNISAYRSYSDTKTNSYPTPTPTPLQRRLQHQRLPDSQHRIQPQRPILPTPTPYPTAVPTPGNTYLGMTVYLDGIGDRGDNTNPKASTQTVIKILFIQQLMLLFGFIQQAIT